MAIYDLTLCGPLHQGEFVGINREAALDWIPSDTLFAALITVWAWLGDIPTVAGCDPFAEKPPFRLTSAFPRAGRVRFYPAPARMPEHCGLFEDKTNAKASKKIRWVSTDVLPALVNGQTPERKSTNFLHGGSVWLSDTEYHQVKPLLVADEGARKSYWRTEVVPHVTIDRFSSASNLFHSGRVLFGEDCGVWFAVRGQIPGIKIGLDYLSDAGLGGLRSTGHGSFSWKEEPIELMGATGNWGFCLSRFAPGTLEEVSQGLQAAGSAYKLMTVGGWYQDDRGHAWRRRSIRMVAEGALLPSNMKGRLVDVRPLEPEDWLGKQRKVYRYGIPFFIPAGKLVEAI